MSELTVLRVEVASAGESNNSSLESGKGKGSTGTSLAAGAIAGKAASGGFINHSDNLSQRLKGASANGSMFFGRGDSREERLYNRTTAREMFVKSNRGSVGRDRAISMYRRNISGPSGKQLKAGAVGVGGVATSAGAVYSIYSNYQKTGLELTGATQAASIQARKGEAANQAIGLGVAVMINPLLAAPMIAMKAYQLAQTNRRTIYDIQKSVVQSTILQRNLVRNVAERRF